MIPTRTEIDRILCPLDFSEFSGPALAHAVRLARWFDARVEVIHVVPRLAYVMPAGGYLPYSLASAEVLRAEREQARQSLGKLVAPLLGEGVHIATRVLEGEPWRVILEEAEALEADLLVMGTHGRSGFEALLLGSVTEKVLRRAPCPVLVVTDELPHARGGPLYGSVLCAADLTQASEQTLDVALSVAAESDARVTLLHVVGTLTGDSGARPSLGVPEIGPLRHELVAEARAELHRVVPDVARTLCDVSERVETGVPWSGILRVAADVNADLIVMGAHAQGALGRALFGSTTSHVVRRAACPVLVVRERQESRASLQAARTAGRLSMA
jgi:nucleotide-binding universal stress UspA family protein